MNNTEFYVPREDWPQPSEEKCTLESIKITAQSKKKKKSDTSKAKKKMSESLAGVTAAAVTVVMLSTSIPALPSIPVFEEVVMDIPDYGWSETCLVCQQEECPYFSNGYSGLHLNLGDVDYNREYEIWSTDDLAQIDSRALYEMAELMAQMDPEELEALYSLLSPEELAALYSMRDQYYTYDDLHTLQGFSSRSVPYRYISSHCVETEAGQRCVLRLDNSFASDLYQHEWNVTAITDIQSNDSMDISYTGVLFTLVNSESSPDSGTTYDVALSSATDYIYAVIAYDKTGENRFLDPDTYLNYISFLDITSFPHTAISQDIPGVPNARLQLVSSLDLTVMEQQLKYCSAVVVDTKDQVFDLGRTMRFTETDTVYRTYGILNTSSMRSGFTFFEGAPGDFRHTLTYDFPFKSHSIGSSIDIYLSDVSWNNIFDLAFDLNQKAPETGHQVFFPAVELNPCTVNNITYRCYLIYHEETYYHTYDALCFMVPQQEMEVAVRFEASLSAEQLENLLDTRDPATAFEISELLNQITLR